MATASQKSNPALIFLTALSTGHQPLHDCTHRLPLVKDLKRAIANGHFHSQLFRQLSGAESGVIALDRRAHLRHCLLNGLSFSDQNAAAAVAGMHGGAGNDQIAHTTETRKGLLPSPHRHAKARHLRHSPGHEKRLGVVAKPHTIADAAAQSQHIFQCAAQLHTDDIRVGIHAEIGVHKNVLCQKSGIDIRSRQTPAFSRIAGGSTFDSEALKFISDVVVSDADEKGRGGFAAVVSSLEYARTIYKNLLRMVRYLTTTQLSRIFIVLGALLLGTTALTPIQLVVSGLVLDLGVILASAFARPPYNALKLRDDAEDALKKPIELSVRSVLFALFTALCVLGIKPVCTLFGAPLSASQFTAAAFTAFILCQLITFAELAAERSIFLPGMRLSVSYLVVAIVSAGFLALMFGVPSLGAIFGIVPLPVSGIVGVITAAALTLGVNEIYKAVAAHAEKKKA